MQAKKMTMESPLDDCAAISDIIAVAVAGNHPMIQFRRNGHRCATAVMVPSAQCYRYQAARRGFFPATKNSASEAITTRNPLWFRGLCLVSHLASRSQFSSDLHLITRTRHLEGTDTKPYDATYSPVER